MTEVGAISKLSLTSLSRLLSLSVCGDIDLTRERTTIACPSGFDSPLSAIVLPSVSARSNNCLNSLMLFRRSEFLAGDDDGVFTEFPLLLPPVVGSSVSALSEFPEPTSCVATIVCLCACLCAGSMDAQLECCLSHADGCVSVS